MLVVSLTLFVAQVLLALSLPQHLRTINAKLTRSPQRCRIVSLIFRAGGFAVLLASLVLAVAQQGPGLGLTYWWGIFAFTGLLVALCLAGLGRKSLP